MSCPVTNSNEWKMLVTQTNEDLAWTIWKHYGDYPVSLQSRSSIESSLGIKRRMNGWDIPKLAKKVELYNKKNGTSHSFIAKRVGQSELYDINLKINYLPVNLERKRQKEYNRSSSDVLSYNFSSPDTYGIEQEDIEFKPLEQLPVDEALAEQEEREDILYERWIEDNKNSFKQENRNELKKEGIVIDINTYLNPEQSEIYDNFGKYFPEQNSYMDNWDKINFIKLLSKGALEVKCRV